MRDITKAALGVISTGASYDFKIEASDGRGGWVSLDDGWEDFTVTCSRTAQTRWVASIAIAPEKLRQLRGVTGFEEDKLAIRTRIAAGVVVPRIGTEWFAWGTYRVDEVDDELSCFSFEKQIEDSRFLVPKVYKAGRVQNTVEDIVTTAVPGTHVVWEDGLENRYLNTIVAERDRLKLLTGDASTVSIAKTIGADMFFDGDGYFRVRDIKILKTSGRVTPDWSPHVDRAVADRSTSYTRDKVFNVVVVNTNFSDGRKQLGPVIVWDSMVGSPTYAGPDPLNRPELQGPFGIVPVFYSSGVFTNTGQMRNVGQAMLRDAMTKNVSWSLRTALNPALEPGDVLEIDENEYVMVESWSHRYGSSTMDIVVSGLKEDISDVDVQEVQS